MIIVEKNSLSILKQYSTFSIVEKEFVPNDGSLYKRPKRIPWNPWFFSWYNNNYCIIVMQKWYRYVPAYLKITIIINVFLSLKLFSLRFVECCIFCVFWSRTNNIKKKQKPDQKKKIEKALEVRHSINEF